MKPLSDPTGRVRLPPSRSVDTVARKRIGEILIDRGKLDAAGLDRALRLQNDTPEKLGALLVTLGLCAPRDVAEALRARLAKTVIGDPAVEGVRMGALASHDQVADVAAQINRLREAADLVVVCIVL